MDRGARSSPVYARARIWEQINDRGCGPGKCDDLHGHGSLPGCVQAHPPSLSHTPVPIAAHLCRSQPKPAQLSIIEAWIEGREVGMSLVSIRQGSVVSGNPKVHCEEELPYEIPMPSCSLPLSPTVCVSLPPGMDG